MPRKKAARRKRPSALPPAEMALPISMLTVLAAPMAAAAQVPGERTMAVSIFGSFSNREIARISAEANPCLMMLHEL